MNFGFTEEQNLLRDQVERFMQDSCPITRVREISDAGGFDATCGSKSANWDGSAC